MLPMKLFLPSARAINCLLVVGFCSIGYALYVRYLAVEQSTVGLACQAGLNTRLCFARQITITLFTYSVFGGFALIVSALNLLRPSVVLFAVALAAACCGVVLYNAGLSALAAGLLVLSLARRAPEPD
jgi:protein-S-isoprenylcysteine O-methyltransferase Ste14